MTQSPGIGPVMLDVAGVELTGEDRELIAHPAVGGVILFSRNYIEPDQLSLLTRDIAAVKSPRPLIAVDQEGGRVQRFRDGFTRLPPPQRFAELYRQDQDAGRQAAAAAGWLTATELGAVGVDFSFAPVLDVERGLSRVIGDRAFGTEAAVVSDLAAAWLEGASAAGMASCGKHFPGHGAVEADSHHELPVDARDFAQLEQIDLVPFKSLIDCGLQAIMPAHVIYSAVDPNPAGFSAFWLQEVLRGRLGFDGMIFSDDLDMAAASAGGGFAERATAALRAGCDMAVVCNNRAGAIEVVQALADHRQSRLADRSARMYRTSVPGADQGDGREVALAALTRLSRA
ncbi:MAG: beta-N-acetylhexosaminidase [Thiohalocapsa sp.]